MPKQNFINKIEAYKNIVQNNQQKEIASEILQKIRDEKDFFVRKKIDGKVDIASGVLLFTPDYKKVLMMDHVKIKTWTFPGGHADGEIDLYNVALQELREEVGIDITYDINHQNLPSLLYKFNYTPKTFGYIKSIITLYFVIICPEDQEPKNAEPDKCKKIKWMDIEEVKEIAKTDTTDVLYRVIELWKDLLK